jgi:drug/metabolite transporter (DMT)-like permease
LTNPITPTSQQKTRAVWMMVAFTLFASVGQTFMKTGADLIKNDPTLMGLLRDTPLQIGLLLYICGAALAVLALRHGELSVLWPIISLSYVWVAILAKILIHESLSPLKIAGIGVIILGVAIMGRAGAR